MGKIYRFLSVFLLVTCLLMPSVTFADSVGCWLSFSVCTGRNDDDLQDVANIKFFGKDYFKNDSDRLKKAEKNNDAQQIESVKTDISDISRKIRELKKQVSLCDSVRKTSNRVESGLDEPTKKSSIEPPTTPPIRKKNRY